MAAQKTARASPELRKGSTQPALPSVYTTTRGTSARIFQLSRTSNARKLESSLRDKYRLEPSVGHFQPKFCPRHRKIPKNHSRGGKLTYLAATYLKSCVFHGNFE